ncbi:MAG TPA: excinuclease ABC subunit UvrC [Edaphocola sp.]|nr:excinuclease ABC subunit UvrC [Edaphocola sp.]
MNRAEFTERFADLVPHAPGIYKYYDSNKKLLYVGKAKNLRKRVGSYFLKVHDNQKTNKLVSLIRDMEWVITPDEHDAFLLENSLIKLFKPPYNINLKDDKTYPYIVIKKEPFPRVYLTRRKLNDGSEYIGPFTDVGAARILLQLIRENIPLRTCSLNLTASNIRKGKFKVCLEYHLGNCKGPCEGFQTESEYAQSIQHVRQLLRGNIKPLLQDLKQDMQEAAAQLAFEKAYMLKQKIDKLQNYQSRSVVVNPRLGDIDVASIVMSDKAAAVNYMMVANGQVVHSKNIWIEKQLDEEPEEILGHAIIHLRSKLQSGTGEIILPFKTPLTDKEVLQLIPKSGDKKKLVEMSLQNASYFKERMLRQKSLLLGEESDEDRLEMLENLQEDMQLPVLPAHIECFDNSNFQGSYPVAAMVCFKNGLPSKKDFRHFHIKTVEGINDFASMSEIVYRRYKRLLDEHQPLPQLVIIDGGKGQLGAAMKSIEKLGLTGSMTVVGLAKREESIFYPGDKEPLQLPYNGKSLLFIRRVRDEVHHFGITFHRQARSKGTFKNELENIPGIGEKTASELLKTFHSVAKIKLLTQRELTMIAGAAKARIVYQYFHPED